MIKSFFINIVSGNDARYAEEYFISVAEQKNNRAEKV